MRRPMLVQIPRAITKTNLSCKEVPVEIQGARFHADLVVLGKQGIEVVLGMDWMAVNRGIIDCNTKTISLTSPEGVEVVHASSQHSLLGHCHKSIAEPALEKVPVVCEYPDVFPEELPGMPPDRDIEFIIELVPGTRPIARSLTG